MNTSGRFDGLSEQLDRLEAEARQLESSPGDHSEEIFARVTRELDALGESFNALALQEDLEVCALEIRHAALVASFAVLSADLRSAVNGFDDVAARCASLTDSSRTPREVPPGFAEQMIDQAVAACIDASVVLAKLGDFDAAEDRLRQAEELAGRGVAAPVAFGLANAWAALALRQGRSTEAFTRAEAAIELGHSVGGDTMIAATANLASACLRIGDRSRARALFLQVLSHPDRTVGEETAAKLGLALATAADHPDHGVPLLVEVARTAHHTQDSLVLTQASMALGWLAQASGQLDVARSWYTTAAAAATDPDSAAACEVLLATAITSSDPASAARLRDQARRHAAEGSRNTQVVIDYIAAIDSLTPDNAESVLATLLPAALVMDTWRIELPWGLPRELWRLTPESGALGVVLALAYQLGRHDLVCAIAAHLGAIAPPGAWVHETFAREPRVIVAGIDPLADAARVAAQTYRLPIRDEQQTVTVLPDSEEGLDLIAVQRGDTYLCWHRPSSGQLHSVRVSRTVLDDPLADLMSATVTGLSERQDSALVHWGSEVALMRRLGLALLPEFLMDDLALLPSCKAFPRLRVRADGDLAVIPWGLLALPGSGEETRLVEVADLVTVAPFGLPVKPGAGASPGEGSTIATVLDPKVPGVTINSSLGSVLGPNAPGGPLGHRMDRYLRAGRLMDSLADGRPLFQRSDQDRGWLLTALQSHPARLLYVGHVNTVELQDGTVEAAMHLCCSTQAQGRAQAIGVHRPFAVSDITDMDTPFPPRVALIACASGDDARTRDGIGLAHAMLCQGTELVTGLRWPVPTGQWYQDIAPDQNTDDPLVALTLAVDQAHESPDPVTVLGDWHRSCLRRWREQRTLRDSPMTWGGLHTVIVASSQLST